MDGERFKALQSTENREATQVMASPEQAEVCIHKKPWLCLFQLVSDNPQRITSAHLTNNLQCTTANKHIAFIFPKNQLN